VISPLVVTEARATAAKRVEGVILSRQKVATNENLLKQLVTNDLEPMLSVQVEIATPPSPIFVANVREGIRQALELRPDFRRAMLTLQNRRVILAFLGNETLPQLDLVGSLRLAGFDNDTATSLSRISKRDRTAWSVGAVMSIPIPNRAARGAEEAGRLEVAQQIVALKELEQEIVVQVDNASGEVQAARERIRSNDAARRLAQETLDAGEERLKAGVLTTFELLELQEKLAQAESAEIGAKADYNRAVSEYYRQTGTSLLMYNVRVE
jgi:outer membrane protein TolC